MPVAPIVIASIIGAGAGVAQSVVAARASGKAANQQAQAGNQAFGLQRDVLNQQQQNIAPYLQMGAGGIGRLNEMMGRQGQSLAGVGMQGGGGGDPFATDPNAPVRFRAPDGRVVMVPHERIKEAIANGGTPLDQGFAGATATPGVTQIPMNIAKPRRPTYREYLAQKPKAQTGLGSL